MTDKTSMSLLDLRIEAQPTSIRCDYARREYEKLDWWRDMFTWLAWALVAATVVFLIVMLFVIGWSVGQWDAGDDTSRIINAALAAGSALSTFVTGAAAGKVWGKKNEHQVLVQAALETIEKYCGSESEQ